jgi:hypothetical protein
MTLVILVIPLLAIAIGLAARYVLNRRPGGFGGYNRVLYISGAELAVVAILMACVFTPIVAKAGEKLSKDEILTYTEFVDGVETGPNEDVVECYGGHSGLSPADGQSNCFWTYRNGTYTYPSTCYRTVLVPDGKGGTTTELESYPCEETATIYTPYATREHQYSIDSSWGVASLPRYNFGDVYLDANPEPYGSRAIPSHIPRGPPADWQDANNRWRAGDPRAVTALHEYHNYILAAKDPVLIAYSNRIPQYKRAGLLPDHTANILHDPIKGPSKSQADKVSFVGVTVADPEHWQKWLMRYNAACGLSKLQCDMHVLLVDAAKVPADESIPYTSAAKAYYQSDYFGKRAIAKNVVILVLGISNNTTITWAEATTGMPHGNENTEEHLKQYLPGTPLTPEALFGTPKTVIGGGKVTITHQQPLGVVEDIMFNRVPYKRVRMECNDGTCIGYKDLINKLEPTPWQRFFIVLVAEFIATLLWLWVACTQVVDNLWSSFVSRFQAGRSQTSKYDPDYLYEPGPDKRFSGRKGSHHGS